MNNLQYWTLNTAITATLFAGLHIANNQDRQPASQMMDPVSLSIKVVQLSHGSPLKEFRDVSLNAVFNRDKRVDLLGGKKLNFAAGEGVELNTKLPIDESWLHDDKLEFKLEFVQAGFIDKVLVRCNQVAKKVSEYNREYQCFIPGDTVALISYRLGNDKVGVSTLAQAGSQTQYQ